MTANLKELVVILVLAFMAFHYAKSLIPQFIEPADFNRRRSAWFLITIVAFVVGNFWIYAAIIAIYLFSKVGKEKNVIGLYFFIIFALPTDGIPIPGFGLINYLIILSHQRLIALIILLPAFLTISGKKHDFKLGSIAQDKILIAYLAYIAMLYFRDTSVTDGLRQTFNNFIDIFLPYFVISRYIKTKEQFRDAILSLLIAFMVMAFIAVFEYLKGWLLYQRVLGSLGVPYGLTSYLGRAGSLRAIATSGHSLSLSFTMMVAIGLFMYVRAYLVKKGPKKTGWLVLIGGIFASLSRGGWLGTIFLYSCFVLTGKNAVSKLMNMAIAGALLIAVLFALPGGQKIVDLLPYIGKTDSANITFREKLYTNSMVVIKRNLITGTPNYLDAPELQAMSNGGLIDIVNTYLAITLNSGIVGLSLFLGFYCYILYKILKTLKSIRDKSSEEHLIGRVLFAIICGMLFTIMTTSPVGVISIIPWMIAALATAYIKIIARNIELKNETTANKVN